VKKNILIIENSAAVTGALKSIARTAYDLKDFFSFIFVVPANSQGRSWLERKSFGNIVELRMKEISKRISSVFYLPVLLVNAFKLRRIIAAHRIDLVHVNDIYNLLPVAVQMLGDKTPYICHIRFLPAAFPRPLFNFWLYLHLRYAKKIIVVSQHLLSQLPKNEKIFFIPNELPVEEKWPVVEDESAAKHFLYLANYTRGKGHDHALEAFYRIHRAIPGWKIRFVGGDLGLKKNQAFKNELQRRSITMGIQDRVEWNDFVDDVEAEYKSASIVLNFSDAESFSITCIEALFFGRPLIATDSGGPAEIVDHGESGILVPVRDIDRMAEAMVALSASEERRKHFAAEGRRRVREKFSVKKTSLLLKEIYHETVA
jgi:L-malate glycosyltransferase